MKKICLFVFIASLGYLTGSAQTLQDTLKQLRKDLDSINQNVNQIKTNEATLNKKVDSVKQRVNEQLIIDGSGLDSARKNPDSVLYKTYIFNKINKNIKKDRKDIRGFFAIASFVILILMWVGAIYYTRNDSLCKDVAFDKAGNQMKAQYCPYSYSRAQLLWWTLIILSCYIFFFGVTGVTAPFNVTSAVLLGFGAIVYSSGKIIDNVQIQKGKGDRNQDQGAQNREVPNFLKDILSDDNGISIHRYQAVIFNLVFGIGFLGFFIKSLINQKYPFPDFTEWQFALLGISSATYLGLKASENKDAENVAEKNKNAPKTTASPTADSEMLADESHSVQHDR